MYILLTSDRRPVYRQVADEIGFDCARGAERECAAAGSPGGGRFGVNLNTIAAAYRELQKEGLLQVTQVRCGRVVQAPGQQSDSDLRKALRVSLAHLVLAGLPRHEITEIVNEEIRDLFRRER